MIRKLLSGPRLFRLEILRRKVSYQFCVLRNLLSKTARSTHAFSWKRVFKRLKKHWKQLGKQEACGVKQFETSQRKTCHFRSLCPKVHIYMYFNIFTENEQNKFKNVYKQLKLSLETQENTPDPTRMSRCRLSKNSFFVFRVLFSLCLRVSNNELGRFASWER